MRIYTTSFLAIAFKSFPRDIRSSDQVAHVGIVESSDDTRHQWNKIRLNWAQDIPHEAGSTGTEPVQGFVKKTEVLYVICNLM